METVIVLLVLFSALLHATWNAFLHTSGDRIWQLGIMSFPYLAVSAAALVFLPAPAAASWPYIAASAALQLGYCVALAAAYRTGDFGQIYPIARGLSPLLVCVGALAFAGEALRPLALAGVALVSLGIVSLAFNRRRLAAESVPAALLTGAFISAYTIVDGIGVRVAGNGFSYIAWVYLIFNVPLAAMVWRRYGGARRLFLDEPRRALHGIAGGAIALVAYGIVIQAFRYLPIAIGVGAAGDELDFRGADRVDVHARAPDGAARAGLRDGVGGGDSHTGLGRGLALRDRSETVVAIEFQEK